MQSAVRRRTKRFSTLVFSCFLAGILIPGCGDGGPTGTDGEGATRLTFTTHPSDAAAGETITPAVEVAVRDASGDPVTASTASVSVALEDNPGGATLRGTTTVTASDGVATFDDLRIESAATGYTLRATDSGLDPDVSAPFQITAAAPTRLGFLTQPSDAEGQEPIRPAVEVAVQDEFGNTATASSASITVALATDPTDGEAALSGTTTLSPQEGVATFADLSLELPADGFTVEASASGLSGVTSEPFAVHLTFAQVSAGKRHSCGVTVADHAYCWGYNANDQLGDGTTTDQDTPVAVSGGHSFTQVAAGGAHTCGITTAAQVFCWGMNADGQLGDGTETPRPTPVAVSTTEDFAQVSLGSSHTCGVTTSGEAYCWGNNFNRQLGDGTGTDRSTPAAVAAAETFAQVSAGRVHTCGVTTDDAALCWGFNASGQLGDGTDETRSTPMAVSSTEDFAQVSAGSSHSCGVTTAGEPFCWGMNSSGQLGDGVSSDIPSEEPVAVSTTEDFARVSAGGSHTCGITTADLAFCWGSGQLGQVGDGTIGDDHPAPVEVEPRTGDGPLSFAGVSAGESHTCGTTTGNVAFCWGQGQDGQVGDGFVTVRVHPRRVIQ